MQDPFKTRLGSTSVFPLISTLVLVALWIGLVGYRAGAFQHGAREIPLDKASKTTITDVVQRCYHNEHLKPDPNGHCWLQGGPAWRYVSEHKSELEQLIPVASKHLPTQPGLKIHLYDNGYSEAIEHEPWFLLNVDADGKAIVAPNKPAGHVESIERTYTLRKTPQGWEVYNVTPLPLDDLLAGRRIGTAKFATPLLQCAFDGWRTMRE